MWLIHIMRNSKNPGSECGATLCLGEARPSNIIISLGEVHIYIYILYMCIYIYIYIYIYTIYIYIYIYIQGKRCGATENLSSDV